MLTLKEQGTMEMADIILGHHLYEFDAAHEFINTNMDDKRVRTLKKNEALVEESEEKAYLNNFIDDYYPNRCTDLNEYSLFNLKINYDVCFQFFLF